METKGHCESKAKKKESDRLRKMRCIQGKSRRLVGQMFSFYPGSDDHLHRYTSSRAPSTYTLHEYTWLQQISTCVFPDILLRKAYSVHAYYFRIITPKRGSMLNTRSNDLCVSILNV